LGQRRAEKAAAEKGTARERERENKTTNNIRKHTCERLAGVSIFARDVCKREKKSQGGGAEMPEQRERDSYLFSLARSLLGERERGSASMEESKGGPRKKRERE